MAHNEKMAEPCTRIQNREQMIWENVLQMTFFHVGAAASVNFYGLGLNSVPVKWATIVWGIVFAYASGLGVTPTAYRLWTQRSHKANLCLRIILMLAYCATGMNPIFDWIEDYRVHDKLAETDGDPDNVEQRGSRFEARRPNFSGTPADPVVMFNDKYAKPLKLMFCFAIPTAIPVVFWGEAILNAVLTQCFIRYTWVLNSIWCVKSVAHLWGDRPYNSLLGPAKNLYVSSFAESEGTQNYYATYPWDYTASEIL